MGNDSLQGNVVAHTKLAAKGDQRLHLLPGRLRRNGRAMQVILLVEIPHQCDSEIAVEAFCMRTHTSFRTAVFHCAVGENYVVIPDVVYTPPIERAKAALLMKFIPGV